VAARISEPQCITSLSGCLWVQFRMSTALVYGCHISILLCIMFVRLLRLTIFKRLSRLDNQSDLIDSIMSPIDLKINLLLS